jgi:hypothetical protein
MLLDLRGSNFEQQVKIKQVWIENRERREVDYYK